jgi:hypothetical protein
MGKFGWPDGKKSDEVLHRVKEGKILHARKYIWISYMFLRNYLLKLVFEGCSY